MDSKQLGAKLKSLRDKKGISLEEVAGIIGVNKSTVMRWERGNTAKMKHENISKLASIFRVPASFFYDTKEEYINIHSDCYACEDAREILSPVTLGKVSAGLPSYIQSEVYDEEGGKKTRNNGDYFYLRIKGNSMNKRGLKDGTTVLVRKQSYAENEDVVVARVNDDEATIKVFERCGNIVYLKPDSTDPDYHPQVYDLTETNIEILGKAVRGIFDL